VGLELQQAPTAAAAASGRQIIDTAKPLDPIENKACI
jgi:hypothetical protein